MTSVGETSGGNVVVEGGGWTGGRVSGEESAAAAMGTLIQACFCTYILSKYS